MVKATKTVRVPQGRILWEGASALNGRPAVAVLTGLRRRSKNAKTGDMLQVWFLVRHVHPVRALDTGADRGVCGDCPLRPALARKIRKSAAAGEHVPQCYVNVSRAPSQIWKAYRRGRYLCTRGRAAWGQLYRQLSGRKIRLGAYGDPATAPFELSARLVKHVARHTGYTHQWRVCDPRFRTLVMASVSSPEEREEARTLGYRTFRVRQSSEPVLPGERVCPASEEYAQAHGGRKVTCAECGACRGTGFLDTPGMSDIVIIDHGLGAAATRKRVQLGLERVQ